MKNSGKLFNIFLLAFHKAKHARPMSSYSEDIPLLKRLGVNVGGAYHSREWGSRIMHGCRASRTPSAGIYEQSCSQLNFGGWCLMDLRTSQKLSKKSFTLCLCPSLANTRLNHKWDVVWRPPIHFPVEEAWFPIIQSRLLGATHVYHKRLFVALSQSYQLYQMTYVKRQKFGKQASRIHSSILLLK